MGLPAQISSSNYNYLLNFQLIPLKINPKTMKPRPRFTKTFAAWSGCDPVKSAPVTGIIGTSVMTGGGGNVGTSVGGVMVISG